VVTFWRRHRLTSSQNATSPFPSHYDAMNGGKFSRNIPEFIPSYPTHQVDNRVHLKRSPYRHDSRLRFETETLVVPEVELATVSPDRLKFAEHLHHFSCASINTQRTTELRTPPSQYFCETCQNSV
jgi:hypothetical protein